jgi:hypothetical protein
MLGRCLAYIAESLVGEVAQLFDWSIEGYSALGLAELFDSRKMFGWDNTSGAYKIDLKPWNPYGAVLPCRPDYAFNFLQGVQGVVGASS